MGSMRIEALGFRAVNSRDGAIIAAAETLVYGSFLDRAKAQLQRTELIMDLEPSHRLAWQRLGTYRNRDEFRGLKTIMAPELSRCFSPPVHEGQRRPYGALIAREDDISELGLLLAVTDVESVRDAADGVNAVAVCAKGGPPKLLRLKKPLVSQDDCCDLAAATDGVLLRVDGNGIIWIASSEAVTTIDDKNGWTRPAIDEIFSSLRRLAPTSDTHALDALVRLVYSYLSPRKVGCILLYSLVTADDTTCQTQGDPMTELGLNVCSSADWSLIEHELRHTDCAAVIRSDGLLLRKAVFLESTSASAKICVEGGTRHNSACRHTYDRPDLLAFVVSADGPVRVFSDGRDAFSLLLCERSLPWNASGGEMFAHETVCGNCGAKLTVRKIILYG